MKIRKWKMFAGIPLLVASLVACNISVDDGEKPIGSENLASIEIKGVADSYLEGTQAPVYVQGNYKDGSTAILTGVAWGSSQTNIATVTSGSNLLALSAGKAQISARFSDFTDRTTVEVTRVGLNGITILGDTNTLPAGVSTKLTARGSFNNGTSANLASATWTSSNESIAQIDAYGIVRAISEGVVTFKASVGKIEDSYKFYVTPVTLTGLTISVPATSIAVGFYAQAKATGAFTDQSTHDMTSVVNWQSSDSTVLAVSASGQLEALRQGEVQVWAVTADQHSQGSDYVYNAGSEIIQSSPVTITVTGALPIGLEVAPSDVALAVGLNSKLTATQLFSDSSALTARDVTWSVADESVVGVSDDGTVSALTLGQTEVTASAGGYEATAQVKVIDAVITGVAISPRSIEVIAGTTATLELNAQMSDGSQTVITDSGNWSVSSADLGTLAAPQDGQITFTAKRAGSGTVSAAYKEFTASTELTVTEAIPTSLQFNMSSLSLPLGLSQQVELSVEYSDASIVVPKSDVIWSVSDSSVGILSAGGDGYASVSGSRAGRFNLIAEYSGLSARIPVEITESIPVGLELVPVELREGDAAQQMQAFLTMSDETKMPAETLVSWHSSNESVAVMSNAEGQKGMVTPVKQGVTTITATHNGGELTASINIEVDVPRLVNGFEVVDYGQNNKFTIGKGEYAIDLRFSGCHSYCVHVYDDNNAGNVISYGSTDISDIVNADDMYFGERVVSPEKNTDKSIVVVKNYGDYYGAIQIHFIDYDKRTVAFSWALKTDGSDDFSGYSQISTVKLMTCTANSNLGKGTCSASELPNNQSAASSLSETPLPSYFTLGDHALIALGQKAQVTNLQATDSSGTVEPKFEITHSPNAPYQLTSSATPIEIPAGHSMDIKLQVPPTLGEKADLSYTFDINNNPNQGFRYADSFKGN